MTLEPPKIIHLDEIEAVPGPGSLTWRPGRLTLGVQAFGRNAYTAGAAADDVVEPHTEDPKPAAMRTSPTCTTIRSSGRS